MFGLIIAFKNIDFSKGILNSPWAGLDNFRFLFQTSDAFLITRNTILYNVVFIILGTISALLIAIMLNEIRSRFFSRFFQTIILIPALISTVIVAYIGYSFFSEDAGILNKFVLPALGLHSVSWYTTVNLWPIILTIFYLWKNVGLLSIIYFASLIGIDKEYYEAAKLDGASLWQQIKNITLPLMRPVITMMLILAVGKIFYSDFGLFYQLPMNSGLLFSATQTIDTYVYRGLMQIGDIGMSSAAGFYQSIVGFVLVMLSNIVVNRIDKESALF
jgi:putative aldouronate transport system permease protein